LSSSILSNETLSSILAPKYSFTHFYTVLKRNWGLGRIGFGVKPVHSVGPIGIYETL